MPNFRPPAGRPNGHRLAAERRLDPDANEADPTDFDLSKEPSYASDSPVFRDSTRNHSRGWADPCHRARPDASPPCAGAGAGIGP